MGSRAIQLQTFLSLSHRFIMTTITTQSQVIQLSNEQLNDERLNHVAAGRNQTVNQVANLVPYVGPLNSVSGLLGGPTIGDLF